MTSIPLSLLDELYLNLDRKFEPWTVHYEVTLPEHLDDQLMRDAIMVAARRHPLARARLARWRFQDRGYEWNIVDDLEHVPLEFRVGSSTRRSGSRRRARCRWALRSGWSRAMSGCM
jgi:hypothetical protein